MKVDRCEALLPISRLLAHDDNSHAGHAGISGYRF